MAVENGEQSVVKDLEPILDEYTGWFLQLVRRAFYPGDDKDGAGISDDKPQSFTAWLKEAQESKLVQAETIQSLRDLHKEFMSYAEQIIHQTSKFMKVPTVDEYDKLTMLFEEFINGLRRIGRDEESGADSLDSVTGLRNREVFYRDVRRELDRLARQGKSFCLALIRIDDYKKMQEGAGPGEEDECQKHVAASIKKIARSFDDIYHMEDNTFVISLKQTEMAGGIKALQRLKDDLAKKNIICKLRGGGLKLSVSSCITEPVPDDNVRQMMTGMKKELDSHEGEQNLVLEYQELSPLQLLLKEGQK